MGASAWLCLLSVHEGLYRNAMFKFNLTVPDTYPHDRPSVQFISEIFHPQVAADGTVDLSRAFPAWRAHEDLLWHVLVYVKRLFYKIETERPANAEAASLFIADRESFAFRVATCVQTSLRCLYLGGATVGRGREGVALEPWTEAMEAELQAMLGAGDPYASVASADALLREVTGSPSSK